MGIDFLDLPDELILQILELMFARDRSDLRVLNKRVDSLISPALFKTVRFSGSAEWTMQTCRSLSEYLNIRKELVFSRCTKKLDIHIPAYGDRSPDLHLPWFRLLHKLIPTLIHLESLRYVKRRLRSIVSIDHIRWCHWPDEHPVSPLALDVFNSFASLQNLRELIIRVFIVTPFPGFTLKSFSKLSSVTINWEVGEGVSPEFISAIADLLPRCPTLEQFTFNIPRPYYPSQVPVFAPLFADLPPTTCLKLKLLDLTGLCIAGDNFRTHLRHFKCLKVLRLMFNRHPDSPEQNAQICRLLLENSIHLDELTIDSTHPDDVLKYLSSYTGLNHLQFCSRYPGADTPEGVDYFFKSVLPRHSSTLRKLYLGWLVETLWTKDVSLEYLAQIEKCQQLTSLYCSVTIIPGYVERADRLLGAWLDTALELPQLKYLTIRATYPPRRFPTLYQAQFCYHRKPHDPPSPIKEITNFGQQRIDKLTAGRVVPFRITFSFLTDGP